MSDAPARESALHASVSRALAAHASRPGPLLEVLHAIQTELGYVPPAAVPLIAEGLNLSRAEVHGVVSFYHHFRAAPAARHLVQLCRAEACLSMRARELEAHARARLGIGLGETRADGVVTLEGVYCLGLCACAPAMLLDGEPHGRVTPERFDALLDELGSPSGGSS